MSPTGAQAAVPSLLLYSCAHSCLTISVKHVFLASAQMLQHLGEGREGGGRSTHIQSGNECEVSFQRAKKGDACHLAQANFWLTSQEAAN